MSTDQYTSPDAAPDYAPDFGVEPAESPLHTAEKTIVASVFGNPGLLFAVLADITPEDFTHPSYAEILTEIVTLNEAGSPVEIGTLTAGLHTRGVLARCAPILPSLLTAAVPDPFHYTRIVRDASDRRRLASIMQAGLQRAGSFGSTPADAAAYVTAEIDAMTAGQAAGAGVTTLAASMEALIDDMDSDDAEWRAPTGIVDLDRLLGGGAKAGQLVVLAARPSVGKTTIGLQVALNVAVRMNTDRHAMLVTMEMSALELAGRAMSNLSATRSRRGIEYSRIERREIVPGSTEETRMSEVMAAVYGSRLTIVDEGQVSPADILRHAAPLARAGKLGCIVVDYFSLMREDSGDTRLQENVRLERISNAMKRLARRLGVPVYLLAQINRGGADKPTMSDLRGTGALEQDADTIVLLDREELRDPETARAGEIDLIVAKQRNGPTGRAIAGFRGHYCQIVDHASNDY